MPVANPLRRNVAIVAHVDHGKTTLVDALLHQSGTFRSNERVAERALDNIDLERERGITILAKNTAVHYGDVLINIVDTPGHADFGGEVERTLSMVDGVMLLVDASEGPLPQTRFVLRKALERGLPPIVVINKIDRSDARPQEVLERDLRSLHRSRRERKISSSSRALHQREGRHRVRRPGRVRRGPAGRCSTPSSPTCRRRAATPTRRSSSWWRTSTRATTSGRIAIGRVFNGRVRIGDVVAVCKLNASVQETRVTRLYAFDGLKRVDIQEAAAGDIVCLAGIEDITIGETIADAAHRIPIPPIAIDEPTVSMIFGVNTSPMAGRDGQYVTSRQLRDRLDRELARQRLDPARADRFARAGQDRRTRRAAAVDPDRDDAEGRLRAPGVAARDRDEGDRRPRRRAGRGAGDRRARGPPGHRHRAGGRAARDDDEDGQQRRGARAPRVPDSGARADRVSRRSS